MTMLIGDLSKRTGCNVETIRYYEKEDILPAPPRTAGGRRVYGAEHLKRLVFVRRSRELGFTLNDIRTLLRLVDRGAQSCEEARRLTLDHAAVIARKIADLRRMEAVLREMAGKCDGAVVPECPILDALSA